MRTVVNKPSISVVVPVHNAGAHLGKCLKALSASEFSPCQIIIVDDCSIDGAATAAALQNPHVTLFRLPSRSGPAAARNLGASHARGEVVLFVDADVVVKHDTLARIATLLCTKPDVAAVFGSYDKLPAETNFVSQYKNLLHHFIHQQSSPEAGTFWAGCGAIHREVFEALGGFDEAKYTRPSVEDIELGYRLSRSGFRVVLDKELCVKHLKRWTFRTLLRADIFDRALPWSRLVLERGEIINDLNLRVRERVCGLLVCGSVGVMALSYVSPLFLLMTFVALIAVLIINLPLYRFFAAHRGLAFASRSFGMQCLYYLYASTVFGLCCGEHFLTKIKGALRSDRSVSGTGLVKDA